MGSGFSESELGTCTDEERSSRNTQIVAVVPERGQVKDGRVLSKDGEKRLGLQRDEDQQRGIQ